MEKVEFVTDTATLCVFDLEALKHRTEDDCDWWSDPDEELEEVNKGNVAFLGLGTDGKYGVTLSNDFARGAECACVLLRCPSGRVFIGAAEEVTSDGLEPEAIRGGTFVSLEPGTYSLLVRRISANELALRFAPCDEPARNAFTEPVRI